MLPCGWFMPNVPKEHAADLDKGWHDYYWKPWKKYLTGKTTKKYFINACYYELETDSSTILLLGLVMAISTVFWIPGNIEMIFWLPSLFFARIWIAKKCEGKIFSEWICTEALANWLVGYFGHIIFSTTYLAGHPEEAEMLRTQMPMPENPRIDDGDDGASFRSGFWNYSGNLCLGASKIIKKDKIKIAERPLYLGRGAHRFFFRKMKRNAPSF